MSAAGLQRSQAWYLRYGKWSLLLSWMPVIGDPITVVAGVLREPLPMFLLLVGIAKALSRWGRGPAGGFTTLALRAPNQVGIIDERGERFHLATSRGAFDGASLVKDYKNQFGRIIEKDGVRIFVDPTVVEAYPDAIVVLDPEHDRIATTI